MKVFFDTLGCPKNFNDTEVASGILEKNGISVVSDLSKADVLIINTCAFINDAKKESIDHIFDVINYKTEDKKIVVVGCLPQRYSKELYNEIPEVDLFVGVNEYEKLPNLLEDLSIRKEITSKCTEKRLPIRERKLKENPYSCTLKISEGCDNSCTYCAIPGIRGGFRSKTIEDVVKEAKYLAKNGCKELVLIGEDVTAYGIDLYNKFMLADLIKELCKIDDIKWIRLMYCYEDKITNELINVIALEDKVCKYIDIPIQHCSNNVLKSMNRNSTKDSILETIANLRKAVPNIAVRTTLIVGFPGETDAEYEELLSFVENTKFDRLGVFAYSQEENTVAGKMLNQIDEETKSARLDGIMRRQIDISLEHNRKHIGEILEVIVDDVDETDNSYVGRTQFDAPEIDNSVLFTSNRKIKIGEIVKVKITDAFDYDLIGQES